MTTTATALVTTDRTGDLWPLPVPDHTIQLCYWCGRPGCQWCPANCCPDPLDQQCACPSCAMEAPPAVTV